MTCKILPYDVKETFWSFYITYGNITASKITICWRIFLKCSHMSIIAPYTRHMGIISSTYGKFWFPVNSHPALRNWILMMYPSLYLTVLFILSFTTFINTLNILMPCLFQIVELFMYTIKLCTSWWFLLSIFTHINISCWKYSH